MKISTALGEGAFGRVMKGAMVKDGKALNVAVKMLKGKQLRAAHYYYCEYIYIYKDGRHTITKIEVPEVCIILF